MKKHALLLNTANLIERIAAIAFAVITLLMFGSAVMRYTINAPIPDAFDFSRLLLGIAVFWGLASLAYRDEHIRMDMVWSLLGPRGQRILDVLSGIVIAGFLIALSWQMLSQVQSIQRAGDLTFETRVPIWPFYATAWVGTVAAAAMGCARLVLTILGEPAPHDEFSSSPQA